MLMENWIPILETYKPTFANSVIFQELTLGAIAPHFEGLASILSKLCCNVRNILFSSDTVCCYISGLRMLDLEPKEISLDVDTRWLGNASCVLVVSSIMGVSFPVQVL
jgi:hypothetical protein